MYRQNTHRTPPQIAVLLIFAVGLFLCTGVLGGLPGNSGGVKGPTTPNTHEGAERAKTYVDGELVVKMTSLDPAAVDEVNALYGTSVIAHLPRLGVYLLHAEGVRSDLELLAQNIKNMPTVEDAHPNFLVVPMEPVQGSFAIPDEDLTGDYAGQQAAVTLDLAAANAQSTGTSVHVAVIDAGVDYNHPVLQGKVVSGFDYVDNDYDAFDESGGVTTGHGTFVAGVIHLVAPDAIIHAYRVTNMSGYSHGYMVAEAIMQAVYDGCQVINLSLVTTDIHSAVSTAIEYAEKKNVVVIAAAGNTGEEEALYPACNENVIAVAAVDGDNALADFSCYGEHIDICAPGVDIYSAFQDVDYAWWSGTSFAAPFVAGQAALYIEKHGDFYIVPVVKDAIIETATDISAANPDLPGKIGAGLIDPYECLSWWPPSSNLMSVIYPDYHEVFVESDSVIHFFLHVGSSPLGAAYLISHHNQPVFLTIDEPSGYTPGPDPFSPNMTINATGLEVGVYQDTVMVEVAGCENSPQMCVITLNVVADAIMYHMEQECITIPLNSGKTDTSYVLLESTNAPAEYSVRLTGPSPCLSLITTSGMTRNYKYDPAAAATMDTAFFVVDASAYTDTGTYYDTLEVTVDGIENGNPKMICIWLRVVEEDAQVWDADPRWHFLDFEEGDDTVYSGSIKISSPNPPEKYYIWIPSADYWEGPEDSVLTWDSDSGWTDGEFHFNLHPYLKPANDNSYGVLVWICKDNKKQLSSVVWTAYISFRVWKPESRSSQPHPIVETSLPGPVVSDVGNFPNPFNPVTDIRFSLNEATRIRLTIYNILGQTVRTLHDGQLAAGDHTIRWDGKDSRGAPAASGIYLYRIEAGEINLTRKMVLLK